MKIRYLLHPSTQALIASNAIRPAIDLVIAAEEIELDADHNNLIRFSACSPTGVPTVPLFDVGEFGVFLYENLPAELLPEDFPLHPITKSVAPRCNGLVLGPINTDDAEQTVKQHLQRMERIRYGKVSDSV